MGRPRAPGSPAAAASPLGPAPLLLAALALAAAAGPDDTRVLGGRPCAPHSQPWQVALFKDLRLRCGGTLVHPQWVLSAAHCYAPGPLMVRLGEHDLGCLEGSEQLRLAGRLIRHPGYNRLTKEHDLMLVKLRRAAVPGPSVQPLGLSTSCPAPGTPCLVSGWGTTRSPQRAFPRVLHCANVTVLECRGAYPQLATPGMVCAAGAGTPPADACQGDSGGPLVCGGRLQGIVSWGPEICGDPRRPGVYVNVCRYGRWIRETMRRN